MEKNTAAVSTEAMIAHEFMGWNRSLDKPVVEISKELFVARKVMEIAASHPAPQAASEGVGSRLFDALEELRGVLQRGTVSIDKIHELGADGPAEEAWLMFYDEIMPLYRAAPERAAIQPAGEVPLGYVEGRPVFVGAELDQRVGDGWVRHNAQESWRGLDIEWENDMRWATPAAPSSEASAPNVYDQIASEILGAPERSGKLADEPAQRKYCGTCDMDVTKNCGDSQCFMPRPAAHSSNAAPSDDLVSACRALIAYVDKNPPMADSVWCVQQIRAALAAPAPTGESLSVPEGYVLVPIKPNAAMHEIMLTFGTKKSEWEALLAAAGGPRHD